MDDLAALRVLGVRVLAGMCWLGALVVFAATPFTDAGMWPAVLAGLLLVQPTLAAVRGAADPVTRIALGATMPLYCALMLAQWSGRAWMIDLHMTFFAAIAMIAVLADWRPVLAAAAVTAVHHLVLDLVDPLLVFGGAGDLARVVLHAAIVIVETAALMQVAIKLEQLLLGRAEAQAAADMVTATAANERATRAAEQDVVVATLANGLRRLANGDLGGRIDQPFTAGFEPLRLDFNRTLASLETLLGQVARASSQIATGTGEIRAASEDLAQRTESQASTVEQAMRTVAALVETASAALARAEAANRAILSSSERVQSGHGVVAAATVTMEKIQQSSTEIGQIVTMIDAIAFQTNLLALNAGVEAARAGESGKGFAVVANEVRALAQRSADAARDIKALITASTELVDEGVELVGQTGAVLGDVVADVSAFAGTVGDIRHAIGDTASSLLGVRDTFGAIDRMTQKNAAMVEQSHAALRSLADEAAGLIEAVRRFSAAAEAAPGFRRAA